MKLAPLLLAALLLTPAIAAAQAASPPSAAAVAEGKAHFERAVVLFREGDFRSALVEFRRAYDLSKNYKVLYNIAQTGYEVQDYAGALRAFQRYLAEGGAEIDAARRTAVEGEIQKLTARVARIEVKSNADGAEVLIDDVLAGKTPLAEPVLVSIGRRKLALQKDGVVSAPRFVDLAGGDRTSVSLDLAEQRPAPAPAPPPAAPAAPVVLVAPVPEPAPSSPSRTGVWVSLGVTGALTAGAVVTGVLALGAHGDAETKLGTLGVMKSDVEAAHTKTATLALATDILGGTAIAMAGVTLVLGLTGKKSSPPAPAATGLTLGPRGAALSGSF